MSLGEGQNGKEKLRKDIHEAEESTVYFEIWQMYLQLSLDVKNIDVIAVLLLWGNKMSAIHK